MPFFNDHVLILSKKGEQIRKVFFAIGSLYIYMSVHVLFLTVHRHQRKPINIRENGRLKLAALRLMGYFNVCMIYVVKVETKFYLNL